MINSERNSRTSKKDLISRLEQQIAEEDTIDVESREEKKDKQLIPNNHEPKGSRSKQQYGWLRILAVVPLIIMVSGLGFYLLSTRFEKDKEYLVPLPKSSEVYSQNIELDPIVEVCSEPDFDNSPELESEQYAVVYVDNFELVESQGYEEQVSFASIVKLLGALVALEEYELDQEMSLIGEVDTKGSGLDLEVGEELSVYELLAASLIGSKNDAMYVLAQNYPEDGVEGYVDKMQLKAKYLGLDDTNVVNPVGFDDDNQYSTTRDISILAVVAMRNDTISELVSKPSYTLTTSTGRVEEVTNTNYLVGEVDGVIGLKTGYTEKAGLCLVSYVEDQRDFITIVMNSSDRTQESEDLIDWVRDNSKCNY